MTTKQKEVTLHCTEGTSDKLYQLWLEAQGDGFMVQAQWGRRGGPMQSGSKTTKPVALAEAEKLYEKTLKDKMAKGYVYYGEAAPAYTHVPEAVDTGTRLMLLTDATGDEDLLRELIADDAWGAEPKLNGKRIALNIQDGQTTGVNRRGLECPIPKEIQGAFTGVRGTAVVDGELVGDTYHLFDCLEREFSLRDEPLRIRKQMAEDLAKIAASRSTHVKFVPLTTGMREKALLVANLEAGRREGAVFKRLDGKYVPGRTENVKKAIAFKFKFYEAGEFEVIRWNAKSSVELGAYEDGKRVSVGNVTVAAKYVKQIAEGGVLRVRYLYATAGRQLYQAVLDPDSTGAVMRDDKTPKECLIGQLKFEGKSEDAREA